MQDLTRFIESNHKRLIQEREEAKLQQLRDSRRISAYQLKRQYRQLKKYLTFLGIPKDYKFGWYHIAGKQDNYLHKDDQKLVCYASFTHRGVDFFFRVYNADLCVYQGDAGSEKSRKIYYKYAVNLNQEWKQGFIDDMVNKIQAECDLAFVSENPDAAKLLRVVNGVDS